MVNYYICIGDRTSGGGVVVEGNVSNIILGRPVASVGMKAICCNRPQTIQQGWIGHLDQDRQIAYDGCVLSCGHTVKASQNLMGWSDGRSDTSIPEQLISKPQKYYEFFTLYDHDNHPVVNQKYRLTSKDGSFIEGYTNAQGQTEHLWTHEELPVNFETLDDDENTDFDKYHTTDKE